MPIAATVHEAAKRNRTFLHERGSGGQDGRRRPRVRAAIACTVRLCDMLEYMSDAELALQPGEVTEQEGKRW